MLRDWVFRKHIKTILLTYESEDIKVVGPGFEPE